MAMRSKPAPAMPAHARSIDAIESRTQTTMATANHRLAFERPIYELEARLSKLEAADADARPGTKTFAG